MASTKRPPSDPPGGRRRRPPTVINLEATEVSPSSTESPPKAENPKTENPETENPGTDDPAPQQQAAEASAPPQTKSEDVPPEQVAFESPPAEPAVESKPPEPPQPAAEQASPPSNPPRQSWLPVMAGLSGLGGGLVLFVLLWVSGALSTGQQASSSQQASAPDLSPRLGAIEQQLKELAARPAPAAADPKALNDIAARLGKLESAVSAPRAPVNDPVVLGRIAAAESAAKSTADNVTALTHRLDSFEASLRETNGQIQQLAVATAELQNHMRETGAGADRPSRLAVAASALRAAVECGEPYAAELAIVKPLASDTAAIGALEPFATSGLPSPAALGQELAAIIRPMLNTPAEAPRDSTFLEKLQANAEKLVRIRPIDEARGDDRIAVLTRIEQRAAQGNIAGAQAELSKLPADIRALASLQVWTAKADARAKAIEAARKLAADAVTSLKPSP